MTAHETVRIGRRNIIVSAQEATKLNLRTAQLKHITKVVIEVGTFTTQIPSDHANNVLTPDIDQLRMRTIEK